ncbi:MAG: ubiquinone-dependent pyruvate dehydrogenase [Muribaculaceae bacterium]|nr:ubiquinone-dependent pyruvate dehydrogenase [Muribaculaceae bacterium]
MENTQKNSIENTSTPKTVAQQVVEMMAESGVKHLYAITGDSLNALTEAISKDGRVKFIHMRHEESGAFAASAEAQLTGQLAACAGSSGPGHVHLINGLYDAQRSNAPVIAIASTCASSMFGTEYFQETNPTLLFSNCSVYNETAVTPTQVPHMLQAAMQEAIGRGGVGVVGLPADVIGQAAEESYAAMKTLHTQRIPEPADEEVETAAQLLNDAKTVAVFAGSGCKHAVEPLMKLAEMMQAPVATTYKSQLELTKDCPNYVGHMGYLGMWSAVNAIANADVILVIGMNFPYPGFLPTDKKIIQVDVRAERLGRKCKVEVPVRADAGTFLNALLPKLQQKTDRTFLDKALTDYSTIKSEYMKPVDNPGTKGAVRPEFMLATLDRLADKNAVFTVDTGMNNVWTSHYLTPAEGRVMLGSFTHGSMANAMPMAIGAKCAAPDRQVIAVCGDGGLAMLMGELLTIVQYHLPVKLLVADNRALAFVKWEMQLAGLKPTETNLVNPDFGKMAKAIGMYAETVDDPAQLEAAMQRWLASDGPALLSVVTDTDAASFSFSEQLMQSASPGNPVSNFLPLGS